MIAILAMIAIQAIKSSISEKSDRLYKRMPLRFDSCNGTISLNQMSRAKLA